jgi:hypothetical protein
MNPLLIEKALDKLRPGWRKRQAKRKSPWNLVCVLVGFGLVAVFWYALFQAAWGLHVQLYPEHGALKKAFWGRGISLRAFIPSFLMLMPLAVPAMTAGFLSANCLMWFIPAARRTMEAEAAGDREMTVAGSNAGLIKWGGLASAVCVILSIIGIATLKSLK